MICLGAEVADGGQSGGIMLVCQLPELLTGLPPYFGEGAVPVFDALLHGDGGVSGKELAQGGLNLLRLVLLAFFLQKLDLELRGLQACRQPSRHPFPRGAGAVHMI